MTLRQLDQPAQSPAELDLDIRSTRPPSPFSPRELQQLAYQTGLVRDYDEACLDLRASAHSTARHGGIWTPVFQPVRRVVKIGIIQSPAIDNISQAIVASLASGLRLHGVPVATSYGLPMSEVQDALLLILEASETALPRMPELLRSPHLALIEARDPGLWGPEVAKLPSEAFTLDLQGIQSAIQAALSNRSGSPVPPKVGADARTGLGDALPLAAAMALAAPCDLATADELRQRFTPHLPFCRLQRIACLPDIHADPTGWSPTPALRKWLSQRVSKAFRKDVLVWQRDRLAKFGLPAGSWAAFTRDRELALLAWELAALPTQDREGDPMPAPQEERLLALLDILAACPRNSQQTSRLEERVQELLLSTQTLRLTRPIIMRLSGICRQDPSTFPLALIEEIPSERAEPAAASSAKPDVWSLQDGELIAVLLGHAGLVFSAAFAPGGERIVSSGGDRTARAWDLPTRRAILYSGHGSFVWSAHFSADGKKIATASMDASARIWDAETGAELATLADSHSTVWSAAFSPDGEQVATVCGDGKTTVWNLGRGQPVMTLLDPEPRVGTARFSPDGQALITTHVGGATIWDLVSGQPRRFLKDQKKPIEGQIFAAAFHPLEPYIVIAGQDGLPRVFDLQTGELLARLHGHTASVRSIAFHHHKLHIVTTSEDGEARVWAAIQGAPVAVLRSTAVGCLCAEFVPQGVRAIMSVASDAVPAILLSASKRQVPRIGAAGAGRSLLVWEISLPADHAATDVTQAR